MTTTSLYYAELVQEVQDDGALALSECGTRGLSKRRLPGR